MICLTAFTWQKDHTRDLLQAASKSRQFLKVSRETSFVLQLRVCLPMQGTWARSLVQKDATCCGAAKPVCHSYWTCALEPSSCNYRAHTPQILKPVHPRAYALQQKKPPQWEACAPQWRVAPARCNERKPAGSNENPVMNKLINFKNLNNFFFNWLPWWIRQSRICLQCGRPGFNPWVGKIPWRRGWPSTPYSCLENSMERGAWQATVHEVAKSWTQLSD